MNWDIGTSKKISSAHNIDFALEKITDSSMSNKESCFQLKAYKGLTSYEAANGNHDFHTCELTINMEDGSFSGKELDIMLEDMINTCNLHSNSLRFSRIINNIIVGLLFCFSIYFLLYQPLPIIFDLGLGLLLLKYAYSKNKKHKRNFYNQNLKTKQSFVEGIRKYIHSNAHANCEGDNKWMFQHIIK